MCGSVPIVVSNGCAIPCLRRIRLRKACRRTPRVRSMLTTSGRIWFAPTRGGLFWIRNGVVPEARYAGLADDVVYSIDGGDGDVWVGRQRGGVTRLRLEGTRSSRTLHPAAAVSRRTTSSRSIAARDGAVWAGTLSGGASRFKDGRFTNYDTTNGLSSNTVASILEATDGTMWFGTPNGLATFSRGGWRTYATGDGLPSNDVNVLFQDRIGRDLGGHREGYCDCRAWSREARTEPRRRDFRDRFSDSPMIAVARSGSMPSTACSASIAPLSSTTCCRTAT